MLDFPRKFVIIIVRFIYFQLQYCIDFCCCCYFKQGTVYLVTAGVEKSFDFCILILYPATLLKSYININVLLIDYLIVNRAS